MSLFFSRHTKLYLVQGANTWEIPIMDGFSFSQAINSSEVTLAEMETAGGVSRRGKQVFNDSFAPAEWSFSTYARPFLGTGSDTASDLRWDGLAVDNQHCVEEALWANFIADNSWTTPAWTSGVATDATDVNFDFDASNTASLGEFSLIFTMGGCAPGVNPVYYELQNSCVNSVTLDFEIDGIATLNWSGYGKNIVQNDTFDQATDVTIGEGFGAADTGNFIRNRLTTLTCTAGDDAAQGTGSALAYTTFPGVSTNGVYTLPLTGGSVSFENNMSYLTPEELCKVNYPLRHVTGTRSISGNFTCYLSDGVGESSELFEHLAAATTVVTNVFTLSFDIGGASAPFININLPTAHLEIPTHSIEDVIAVDIAFTGLPSDITGTDEATVTYTGA